MKRFDPISLLFVFVCFASIAYSQANAPLKLSQMIPLPGVEGRIDHMSVDVKAQRLFVAALGNLAESKNYAVTLSFLDVVFGTFYYRPGGLPERLGIVNPAAYPKSSELHKVMMLPFEGVHGGRVATPVTELA